MKDSSKFFNAWNDKGETTTVKSLEDAEALRKEGKLDEALSAFLEIIDSQERRSSASGEGVAPFPYEEVAKIYRKTKDRQAEVAILERFAMQRHAPGKSPQKLFQRLSRAYELSGQIETKDRDGKSIPFHIGYNIPLEECPPFVGVGSIVDVETTGFSEQDDIVELGMVTFRFSKLSGDVIKQLDEYQSLHEPCCAISPAARKVHGLSFDDVRGKHIDEEYVNDILCKSNILIAHNAGFDRRFLAKYFPSVNNATWYCTMAGIPWKSYGFPSRKLQDVIKGLGIDLEGDAHRGLSDAKAVLSVLARRNEANGNMTYLSEMLEGAPVSAPSKYWEDDSYKRPHGNMTVTLSIGTDGSVSSSRSWDNRQREEDVYYDHLSSKKVHGKATGTGCFAFLLMTLVFLLLSTFAFAAPRDVPITTEAARQYLTENPSDDKVRGLYELIKGRFHGTYLVLPATGTDIKEWEYVATALETTNRFEKPGSVKFFMRKKEGRYVGFYFDSSFSQRTKFRCQFVTTADNIIAYIFPSSTPSILTKIQTN